MIGATLLFLAALSLSAFFSGSETGLYRVSRVRLVLDARGGDLISRGLLWLTNHPAWFVATTLIGNNVANYAASLAVVIAVEKLSLGGASQGRGPLAAELIAPVALTPLLFIYGELLPKSLFLHAPNQLLRRVGPLLLTCVVLFWPVSAVLSALGRVLQSLLGEAPLQVRLTLARKELSQMLHEGQEAGLLRPSQRRLAQNLIAVAPHPVMSRCTPMGRVAWVRLGAKKSEVLRMARRRRTPLALVIEPEGRAVIGYIRVVELYLDNAETVEKAHPLLKLPHHTSHIAALIRMQIEREPLACLVNDRGDAVGLLDASRLAKPLFRGI